MRWQKEVDDFAALLSDASVYQFLARPERDLEGMKLLGTALLLNGISMSICGSSRPASGSEHLISHALDALSKRPRFHGLQVGVATYLMSLLQGQNSDRIADLFRQPASGKTSRTIPFDRDEWLEASRLAPSIKSDFYTVLSSRDCLPEIEMHFTPILACDNASEIETLKMPRPWSGRPGLTTKARAVSSTSGTHGHCQKDDNQKKCKTGRRPQPQHAVYFYKDSSASRREARKPSSQRSDVALRNRWKAEIRPPKDQCHDYATRHGPEGLPERRRSEDFGRRSKAGVRVTRPRNDEAQQSRRQPRARTSPTEAGLFGAWSAVAARRNKKCIIRSVVPAAESIASVPAMP